VFGPAARAAGDKRQEITEFCNRKTQWICGWITEEFEEGGGEKGVGEFDGIATGLAQPICLVQFFSDRRCSDKSGNPDLNAVETVLVMCCIVEP